MCEIKGTENVHWLIGHALLWINCTT